MIILVFFWRSGIGDEGGYLESFLDLHIHSVVNEDPYDTSLGCLTGRQPFVFVSHFHDFGIIVYWDPETSAFSEG